MKPAGTIDSKKEAKVLDGSITNVNPKEFEDDGDHEIMDCYDPRCPGIVIPIEYFKISLREKYPEYWKQINALWNNPKYKHYGIRHPDDDWSAAAEITGVGFLVNRYGILFTKEDLKIDEMKYGIPLTEGEREYYQICWTNEIDLEGMIEANYKAVEENEYEVARENAFD